MFIMIIECDKITIAATCCVCNLQRYDNNYACGSQHNYTTEFHIGKFAFLFL